MNPSELIALARALVNGVITGYLHSPTQTELRRAVSCAYYAMFHTLVASNANTLVGTSPADQRRWAWQQTYRAADHRPTRNKLSRASLGSRFPEQFADSAQSLPIFNAHVTPLITIPIASSQSQT